MHLLEDRGRKGRPLSGDHPGRAALRLPPDGRGDPVRAEPFAAVAARRSRPDRPAALTTRCRPPSRSSRSTSCSASGGSSVQMRAAAACQSSISGGAAMWQCSSANTRGAGRADGIRHAAAPARRPG